MRRIKYKTSVSLLIVLASVVLVLLCLLIVHTFRTGEEATVGIFSLRPHWWEPFLLPLN